MTVELSGLMIEAADPLNLAAFWHSALGGAMDVGEAGVTLSGPHLPDLLFVAETEGQ